MVFDDRQIAKPHVIVQMDSLLDAVPLLADFAATAAPLERRDPVVTVDTAVCHLAGAGELARAPTDVRIRLDRLVTAGGGV